MSALMGIRIEKERRRLQRASAILACLVIAANEDPEQIDCSDVALVARELVEAAIAALDSVELERASDEHAKSPSRK